jgi:hypothetical protein
MARWLTPGRAWVADSPRGVDVARADERELVELAASGALRFHLLDEVERLADRARAARGAVAGELQRRGAQRASSCAKWPAGSAEG